MSSVVVMLLNVSGKVGLPGVVEILLVVILLDLVSVHAFLAASYVPTTSSLSETVYVNCSPSTHGLSG
jgi:hypothetical protein